ncbi:MAG: hypothetical protein EBT13_16810, partial [Rhodobacteraceae bacterium]|nr:hypothetical protein [Paracoccaceae bacterium]
MASLIKNLFDRVISIEGKILSPFVVPSSGGYIVATNVSAATPTTAALNADRMTLFQWTPRRSFTAVSTHINVTV